MRLIARFAQKLDSGKGLQQAWRETGIAVFKSGPRVLVFSPSESFWPKGLATLMIAPRGVIWDLHFIAFTSGMLSDPD
jgi:hypothetical protein